MIFKKNKPNLDQILSSEDPCRDLLVHAIINKGLSKGWEKLFYEMCDLSYFILYKLWIKKIKLKKLWKMTYVNKTMWDYLKDRLYIFSTDLHIVFNEIEDIISPFVFKKLEKKYRKFLEYPYRGVPCRVFEDIGGT